MLMQHKLLAHISYMDDCGGWFLYALSWVYLACPNQDKVLSYRLTLASKSPDLQKSFESTKYVRLLRMMNK